MTSTRPGPTPRVLKVGEEMKRVLAQYFQLGQFITPDLAKAMVTVQEIRMSSDLKLAKVFVTSLTSMAPPLLLAALKKEAPLIRKFAAHAMHLKYVPTFIFRMDESKEYATRIESLLASPVVKRDVSAHHDESEE